MSFKVQVLPTCRMCDEPDYLDADGLCEDCQYGQETRYKPLYDALAQVHEEQRKYAHTAQRTYDNEEDDN